MLACPKCAADTCVLQSYDDGRSVVRLRECKRCGNRFLTTEVINNEVFSLLDVIAKLYEQQEQQ